jgi:membrane-bound metal-dependent hydrolase YbcI (DUF457 family)
MKWTTHSIFGATLTAFFLLVFKMGVMPIVIALGAIGATFPDIDHPNSKVSNANVFTKVISVFAIFMITIFNFIFNALGKLVPNSKVKSLTGVHRSPITHSLLTVGLFALLFIPVYMFLPHWWYFALIIGILSHVLIDSINPSGTPLFWPISQSRIRFIPEAIAPTTGTMGEGMVTIVVSLLLAGVLLLNWNLYKVNFTDLEQLFGGVTIPSISNPFTAAAPAPAAGSSGAGFDFGALPSNLLPAGSIRLPDGQVVLPDGKPLSSLSMVEFNAIGIPAATLKSISFTPVEAGQFQQNAQDFLVQSGIWQLFTDMKAASGSKVPTTFVLPGTKGSKTTTPTK